MVAYCEWLGAQVNRQVRLPAEAEWEKAARGGFEGRRYPCGDEINPSQANFLPDPSVKRLHATKPVGSYPPNAYGFYDMAGNVWEWVSDWYDPGSYAAAIGTESPTIRIRTASASESPIRGRGKEGR